MKTRQLLLIFTLLLPIGTWADEYTDPETNVIYTYTVGSGVASVKAGTSSGAGSPEVTGDTSILLSFTVGGNNYSVTSIGDFAFRNCSSLTSITIPSSVTSIGNSVFYGCRGLTSVSIQSDLTSIGNSVFYNCSSLSSVTIPSSVTSIGIDAFGGCSGLTSITIPSSVTSIGNGAFSNCRSLTSITIPSGVTSIGHKAFERCSGLTSIIVDESNTFYDSRGNCNAIIKTSNNELIAGFKNTVIPNSVASIGDYAFYNCSGLTSLTIPDGVATIGTYAFSRCDLTSITLPNSVTSIGNYAFFDCTSLTSITLSNSVTYIGNYTFSTCIHLTSITIPSAVTSIEGNAFYSCTRLNSITMMGNPTIGSNAFPSNKTITQNLTPNSVGSDKWLTYYNNYANFQADANTKVYKGSVEDGNVMLTAVNDKIVKAGEAVLLKSTSATITMISTTTASADDYADNELRGLNTRTATSSILTGGLSGGTIYVLGNQNSHFGFHEYTGDYMAANKAFLALPSSSSGSRRLSIVFRNGETGVDMPISETEGTSADDWYTLDGRKLVAEPTASGVYVNQGKKIIVK